MRLPTLFAGMLLLLSACMHVRDDGRLEWVTTIKGVVLDEDDRPVPGASVDLGSRSAVGGCALTTAGCHCFKASPGVKTDARGFFELSISESELKPQSLRVLANQQGLLLREKVEIDPKAGRSTHVTVRMIRSGPVSGVVRCTNEWQRGRSMENRAEIRSQDPVGYSFTDRWSRIDENGRFEIRNLRPGSYTLYVEYKGCATNKIQVQAPSTDLDFDLPAGVEHEGILLDENGQRVARKSISISTHEGGVWHYDHVTTADNGYFRFSGVPEGTYSLVLTDEKEHLTSAEYRAGKRPREAVLNVGNPQRGPITVQLVKKVASTGTRQLRQAGGDISSVDAHKSDVTYE